MTEKNKNDRISRSLGLNGVWVDKDWIKPEPGTPKEKLLKAISVLQAEVNTLQAEIRFLQDRVSSLEKECEGWCTCLDFLENIVVVVKPDGNISLINEKGRRLLGFRSSEEYANRLWHELCFEPAVGEAVRFLEAKLLSGDIEKVKHYRTPVITRYGWNRIISWRSVVLRDKEDKPYGILHYGHEISEEKQKEILSRPEVRYQHILDIIPVPMHLIDRAYHLLVINQAFKEWCQKLGLPLPIEGQNLFAAFPFLPEKVRQEYEEVFRTGQPLLHQEKTGLASQTIMTETRKIPVLEEGEVRQIMTVIQKLSSSL
ncbi:MAG: PAS domain-containing protein [Candidatus Omnitrophica bacterium]|nr:PAS domain-containing protein [Candidatus Omnitrophota bacterium]